MSGVEGDWPPPPRAILFDWDNTLVDNWPAIHEALNATFAAMGHPLWTLEETRDRVRESLRESFPRMFGDDWTRARKVFYRRFAEVHMDRLNPLPGAEEALAALAETEVYLGVVSNKAGRYLREEASALGWDRYFRRIVGATDAAADKPDPAPVALALADSGIVPGPDVWFVGDGAIDVDCALRSGLTPIVVVRERTLDELRRHNLDPFVGENFRIPGVDCISKLVLRAD